MKKNINNFNIILYFAVIFCASSYGNNLNSTDSLKKYYSSFFNIGAAINEDIILGLDNDSKQIVETQFNSITPENSLKWMFVQPYPNSFNFTVADKYVNIGLKNKMHIVGHALVWHSQLADFMQNVKSKAEMNKHFENHINTVVSRYKGKIDAWDVVNEAFNEDGSLRESVFYKFLGKNYIEKAFKLANEIDPNADLIYNDYNLYKKEKRDGVIQMVKQMQSKGIKIDGIGVQAHWSLNQPSLNEIEQIIFDISELGVDVMFTELDISVLPSPWEQVGAEVSQNFSRFEGDAKMNPYPDKLPKSIQNKLAKRYNDIFQLFIKHSDKISRVTFWGVMDKHSWLNDFPIKGRTNYPLLFDRNYQAKEAHKSLIILGSSNKINH
ncbi:endo-1,4-beta-xylanase [Flavobacteriaceae bacterium]|nr:endo-1,4-beta-xylanase [Flavobacteriaceae bacterium]MDB4179856.1 endo-1,4-beta-xylanase [Flavobacteriaceae bacterium]